ncbi:MAG TPA: FkbM family methyltransferase [Mucilaginibacter sp.]
MQKFSATQFIIIFRKFFSQLLEAPFNNGDNADYKLSDLSENKFFIYPFISTQKEFGYSDITTKNSQEGYVDELFANCAKCIQNIKDVGLFYKELNEKAGIESEFDDYESIIIPTYVIGLSGMPERREHIMQQFEGKTEFDVILLEAVKNKPGALDLWQSTCKVIELAVANDDDVIIICQDDHEFTENYSKLFLIKNIIEGYRQGANILAAGIGHFLQAVPITGNRFWVDFFYNTPFIVVYRNMFQKILDEPFHESAPEDDLLSLITSNKMVLFPFISIQKEFGGSSVAQRYHNETSKLFTSAADRLEVIRRVFNRYTASSEENDSFAMPLTELITRINNSDFQNAFVGTGYKNIDGLDVFYRKGTCDDVVIKETFQDELFEKGFPEYKIKKNHLVIDIGAHIGAYSLKLSRQLTDGLVYAFEPCLDTFTYLEKNVVSNNIKNINIIRVALSDHVGETKLYYDHRNGSWGHSIVKNFSSNGEMVQTDTLSNFFKTNSIRKCDFMKFNCEGAEFKILLSTPTAILQRIRHILVLYHLDLTDDYTIEQLVNHLKKSGFYTNIRQENPQKQRGWLIAFQSKFVELDKTKN